MHRILPAALLVALVCTCACTIGPEVAKPNWSQATSGEQYERLFWESVKAKNWRDVEAHLSGTVVTETPDAVRNKQQTMEHIRQLNLSDYSMGEIQTETSGADIIVTYTMTIHGTIGGQPVPEGPMRMMTIWQQAKKGMIMTAHTTMPGR
jgi:galactitol-specific phosphotransferase system IIB component